MGERALRGTRLGATSYENDSGIDLAPRQDVEYSCLNGHRFGLPFSVEAEVPATWECRVCGAQALRVDGVVPEEKPGRPARTHWDMLLERRSVADLEEVLAERLEVLRGGGIGFAVAMGPLTPAAKSGDALGTGAKDQPTSATAPAKAAPAGRAPAATKPGAARKAQPSRKASASKAVTAARRTGPAKATPASAAS